MRADAADENTGPCLPDVAVILIAVALLAALTLPGLHWGLPSAARNELAIGPDRADWRAPAISEDEAASPWDYYPNYLAGGPERPGAQPRSAFNPIRSYHPDEYVILKSLSGMRPSQVKFFHGFFGWPALQFYVVGGALKAASLVGAVDLVPAVDFYFQNPEAMARLYVVGRLVTWLFALGCVLAIWRSAQRLLGRAGGGWAILLLAVTPLFTINARYMTADVPMLFWIGMVLLASTRILTGGGRRWYVFAGVFLGLAAGTRYQGGLAAFLLLAAHLLRTKEGDSRRSFAARLAEKELWIAAGISLFAFLAVNPYVLLRPAQFVQEFLGELRGSRNAMPLLPATTLFLESALGILLAMATFGAIALALKEGDRAAAFLLAGFGIPAFFLWTGRPVMARYFLPVLPLPILLTAWALGRLHRRGLERGGGIRALAAPALFAVLFLFTFQQSWSYSRLFADPAADTRTRAGAWIAENVPPGATVGTITEPWQFDLPPLDKTRHSVIIVRQDVAALRSAAPDFFVSSDLQFPPLAVRGRLSDREMAFWNDVFHGGDGYEVAARFEAWPAGRRGTLRHGPHDMRYVNPVIVIARRRAP